MIYERICCVCKKTFYCAGLKCNPVNDKHTAMCYCPKHINVFKAEDCGKYFTYEQTLIETL